MSKDKTCIICGKKIGFCGKCRKISYTELWRNEYCSEECRQIFKTCARYGGKDISKEDAYNVLKSLNVESKDLQFAVKNTVDEIMNFRPVEIEEIKQAYDETSNLESSEIKPTTEITEEQPKHIRPRNKRVRKIETE